MYTIIYSYCSRLCVVDGPRVDALMSARPTVTDYRLSTTRDHRRRPSEYPPRRRRSRGIASTLGVYVDSLRFTQSPVVFFFFFFVPFSKIIIYRYAAGNKILYSV